MSKLSRESPGNSYTLNIISSEILSRNRYVYVICTLVYSMIGYKNNCVWMKMTIESSGRQIFAWTEWVANSLRTTDYLRRRMRWAIEIYDHNRPTKITCSYSELFYLHTNIYINIDNCYPILWHCIRSRVWYET